MSIGHPNKQLGYGRETAQCMLQNSNLVTGGVGLCCDEMSMDRLIGEWLYYNFAAGSFHTKKLRNELYLIIIEFYFKYKISLFKPLFRDLGVMYALHL